MTNRNININIQLQNIRRLESQLAAMQQQLRQTGDVGLFVQERVAALNLGMTRFTYGLDVAQLRAYNTALNAAGAAGHTVTTAINGVASATNAASASFSVGFNNSNKFFNSFDPNAVDRARKALDRFDEAKSKVFAKGGVAANIPIAGGFLEGIGDVLDPGKISTALGYRLAYGIADMPIKAIRETTQAIKNEIDSASSLEGELYDLQAYLGGPGGKAFDEYGKSIGRIGDSASQTTQALQDIQNKILQVGQNTTFTSLEIARALTEASKAGVTMQELGKPGEEGALDAIALLAQNTGEPLEKTAQITAKLQEAFQSNLGKSQVAFGGTADAAKQYMLVVNALAQADAASAASASQLTEALFNVGGSANNINMSFFDTLSLVSAMVPAFESAASAGTSLKYVFSRMTGANSTKAQDNMKLMGLMDQSGQSVFFDKNGFKGMEFMVRTLRETFGEKSGMAVDVRNRIITEIFGQDAQKAISRMISMTEEQAQQLYQTAQDMTEGARQGTQYAAQTAAIKNEGLEFDIEYLRGSLDSLSKTMTVPLLKPMSQVTQTFSGFANGMFAILQGAGRTSSKVTDALEYIDEKMLPGSTVLFNQALDYAETLKVGLDAILKTGFNTTSIATAIAALLGTEKSLMSQRIEEYKLVLVDIHAEIVKFIKNLPSLLTKLRDGIGWVFENIVKMFNFIKVNWKEIVFAMKAVAAVMVAEWALSSAKKWWNLADALFGVYQEASKIKNLGNFALALSERGGLGGAVGNVMANVLTAPKSMNTWSSVFTSINTFLFGATVNGTKVLGIFGKIGASLTFIFSRVGAVTIFTGAFEALGSAVAFLLSPLGMLIAAIGTMAAAWYSNVTGIREWLMKEFGGIYEYVSTTFTLISQSVMTAWAALSAWLASENGQQLLVGVANGMRALTAIVEGAVLLIGGALKVIVGLVTFNGDLIGSGLIDMFGGIMQTILGLTSGVMAYIQSTLNAVVKAVNWASSKLGLGNVIDQESLNAFFNQFISKATTNGMQVATDYAKGLINGTNKSQKDVSEAGGKLGDSLDKGLQKSLGIRSPSTNGITDGEYFGEGVSLGITNSIPLVQNAISQMVETMTVDEAIKNMYKATSVAGFENAKKAFYATVQAEKDKKYEKSVQAGKPLDLNKKTGTQVAAFKTQEQKLADIVGPNVPAYIANKFADFRYVGEKGSAKAAIQQDKAAKQVVRNDINGAYAAARMGDIYSKASSYINEQIKQSQDLAKYKPDKYFADSILSKVVDIDGILEQSNGSYKFLVNETKKSNYINEQTLALSNKLAKDSAWQVQFNKDQDKTRQNTENDLKKNKLKYGPAMGPMIAASGGKYYKTSEIPMADPGSGYMYVGNGVYVPTYNDYTPTSMRTTTTYRNKTDQELAAMQAPGYLKLTQIPIGAMRGDFANLPLDQYSTPEYDVAKGVKQFQFATGDRAIAQRGLTEMFANKDISAQFANIGNRAATYLSMRQGQLKPNEVLVYKQLLEQDKQDRFAYMDAVKTAKEQIAAGGDVASIIKNLVNANQSKTQTFKDVFDVKIGSLKDYTAETGGAFDQYAKLGPQAFNEAISVALNPANQSAAFQALSPEARQQLIESVQNLPSQAMAFLGDAMADGTLDSTEFETYMQYVGEDIKNMRNILMRGTPPTQEELDAAFNPFIDGAATLVKSDKVTGVLGNALVGASKMLFQAMGKDAWDAFLKGWMTNEKGEKVAISGMTISDLLQYTPQNLKDAGIPVGQNIFAGITKGLQEGLVTASTVITDILGPNGKVIQHMESPAVTNSHSPSLLYRDTIGKNIGLGIADGLKLPEVMNAFGLNTVNLLNSASTENPWIPIIAETAKTFGVFIGTNIGDGLLQVSTAAGPENLWKRSLLLPLKEQVGKGDFSSAFVGTGKSIAQGLSNGIDQGTSYVKESIANLMAEAVAYAHEVGLIQSPSKLFANEVGFPISAGIAQGITKNSSMVSDALNPLLTDNAMYKSDISGTAINGMIRRSQMSPVSSNVENNYNLSLATSYPGQTVQQQFEIMRAFKGR